MYLHDDFYLELLKSYATIFLNQRLGRTGLSKISLISIILQLINLIYLCVIPGHKSYKDINKRKEKYNDRVKRKGLRENRD